MLVQPLAEVLCLLNSVPKTSVEFPIPAFEKQDALFQRAFGILNDAIAAHGFPGASVAVTLEGRLVALKAVGRFTYDSGSPEITVDTSFDLASVSKVIATTSMAMVLYEGGFLDLDMPVVAAVPEFGIGDPRRREVTVRMLLSHSSGLPAYERLFLRARTPDELLTAAFLLPLAAGPGTVAVYGDIGFIVLGVVLARLADERLDEFCYRHLPRLGMPDTLFNPPARCCASIPPTADDRTFRKRIIQGEVQDENASTLGGVAGHAGLFGPARDLANFAHAMLLGGRPLIRPETLSRFTRRESTPQGTSRALGWDTPSQPSQSGKYFSPHSFGHLGYTGTSLWIDPERRLSVTLLTNRTWPDCQNQAIKQVRPKFHDAIVEALQHEK